MSKAASDLLRVTVEIGQRRFDEDLRAQAFIAPDIDSINEALARNPGLYAEWAMLEALARKRHDLLIGELDVLDGEIKTLEAELFLSWQQKLTRPDSKPNLDTIKSSAATDARRREIGEQRNKKALEVVQAKGDLETVAVGRKTIDQKRDSLLEIARDLRAEMDAGLNKVRKRVDEMFPEGQPGIKPPEWATKKPLGPTKGKEQ